MLSIQEVVRRKWHGIDVERAGRPGNSNIVNQKHKTEQASVKQIKEKEKMDLLLETVFKLKELDELKEIRAAHERFNKVQSHYDFHNISTAASGITLPGLNGQQVPYLDAIEHINKGIGEQSYAQRLALDPYKFLNFRQIKPEELLHNVPPTMCYGGGKQQFSNVELLYKMFRGDTKLIRSVLEANHFSYTESHEWNILWSSSSCKSYLYEGLNEHQKINHFP